MFNFIRPNVRKGTLNLLIRCYSLARKTHYDILRLRRNCSDKEIKEAFIKLSKEYHPDINKNSNAQQHFVRIVEAYNVLGKPSSRARYDSMTASHSPNQFYSRTYDNSYKNYDSYKQSQEFYHTSYGPRPRHKESSSSQSERYYGGVGVKRIPSYVLIIMCVSIAFVGTLFQVYVIREMYVVQKRQAIAKSKHLAEELEKVRTAAQENTNEMQTRILLEKIVGSSNPTIATATLGQALAGDKK